MTTSVCDLRGCGTLCALPSRWRPPRVRLHAGHDSSGERAVLTVRAQAQRIVLAADDRAGYETAAAGWVAPPVSIDG